MKNDIVLAGVGGQGILSIAAAIGMAALEANLQIKQAETHGMSQRGGAVQSYLRISSEPIFSDLIQEGKADLILAVEPMESLRYLPYLKEGGFLVTNAKPFVNIPNYPDEGMVIERVKAYKNHVILDADAIAKELGTVKASNMVMLGAASPFIDIELDQLLAGIRSIFSKKGDKIVELNSKAFEAGRKTALDQIQDVVSLSQ